MNYNEELARLQAQNNLFRIATEMRNAFRQMAMPENAKEEKEETVKKKKSPFEYRVEQWNVINEEIRTIETFINEVRGKRSANLFTLTCFEKNKRGINVYCGAYRYDLPYGLQVEMIRVAEEYLEELKQQRKDMEQGYE